MNRTLVIGLALTGALTVTLYQVKERAGNVLGEVERLDTAIAQERQLIATLEVQLARSESATALAPAIERLDMVPMTVDREWTPSELRAVPELPASGAKGDVPARPVAEKTTEPAQG